MRWGLFADVHGNALQTAAALALLQATDRLIFLGDVLPYGDTDGLADCLTLFHHAHVLGIKGNCDRFVERYPRPADVSPALWDYYGSWPLARREDGLLFVHGGPLRADSTRIHSPEMAWRNFLADDFTVCFHGHTHLATCYIWNDGDVQEVPFTEHQPLRLQPGERYIIGVGSLGVPRDHRRGSLAIFDDEQAQVTLMRLP
ncbi:metallophosphoesterase family protein [Heliophilum fasciatum]|uniref:Putative phosphodiesterase n=1 Tax=Heliophilum fasciatum TaxID=35700 RepID=A0A4R2RJD5_9FIRM|nr:metallophosphoesterase family protein [Heliophilum fasciatum]MCW2278660.1 putative phosphodiesterase [Heliophilum fasciatum]TCP62619.1 putative phosphodiesterase [Heliophilum fasciatum]